MAKQLKPVDKSSLLVREIFATIQGEGPHAGRPAVFVRTGGCNLKCTFCDTDFRVEASKSMSSTDVVTTCIELMPSSASPLVVVTGGEPLMQPLFLTVERLLGVGVDVQIETAGTLDVGDLRLCYSPDEARGKLSIVVSPKTGRLDESCAQHADAFKYIVRAGELDEKDGLPVVSTQDAKRPRQRLARPRPGAPVFLQPMDESDAEKNKRNTRECVEACLRFGYRLSLQQHKIVGLP